MNDVALVTLEALTQTRADVQNLKRSTNVRLVLYGLVGGLLLSGAFFALGKVAPKWPLAEEMSLVGLVFPLLAVGPSAGHWSRHFSAILSQLDSLEQRVRAGEKIDSAKVEFKSYK